MAADWLHSKQIFSKQLSYHKTSFLTVKNLWMVYESG